MQTTSYLLMIRPVQFGFNTETAVNNAFQSTKDFDAQKIAVQEFDDFVLLLWRNGIDVTVIDDTPLPSTPDSIFPNNWISFHDDGQIVFYPMFASNRRAERKPHVVEKLKERFHITGHVDLSFYEHQNIFLEGTGSMVLDRRNKIAYACLSDRTNPTILNDFCLRFGYTPISFEAIDANGYSIYHTNVMMCVADQFIVIRLATIKNEEERKKVIVALQNSNKEIIKISMDQMNHFAGNMLQVENDHGKKYLVMSSQAYHSLNKEQILTLEYYNTILHSSLDIIERNGGGSARCMMAEIFLPLKRQR